MAWGCGRQYGRQEIVCLSAAASGKNQNISKRSVIFHGADKMHHADTCDPLVAEKTGLARTRFAYYCRKLTNLSPMEYLQRQRVEKAKILLADRKQSITEIALNCGFGSSAYFSTAFRRNTHCSPREYREQRNR